MKTPAEKRKDQVSKELKKVGSKIPKDIYTSLVYAVAHDTGLGISTIKTYLKGLCAKLPIGEYVLASAKTNLEKLSAIPA